jgi:transcriptional regulator with XRE-family HTH domain
MIRTMPQTTKRLPEGPFYRDLGRNLRVARIAAGKSQGKVAEYLDVSFQQIQKYEKGMNRIPVDSVVSLATYLEVPLLQLIAPTGAETEFQSHAAKFGAKEFKLWGRNTAPACQGGLSSPPVGIPWEQGVPPVYPARAPGRRFPDCLGRQSPAVRDRTAPGGLGRPYPLGRG